MNKQTKNVPRHSSHHFSQKGFSLVEAVVALALCGIIAIPMYQWFVANKWNRSAEYKYIAHRVLEDALHKMYLENRFSNKPIKESKDCWIPCVVSIRTERVTTSEGFVLTWYMGQVRSKGGDKLASLRLSHFTTSESMGSVR